MQSMFTIPQKDIPSPLNYTGSKFKLLKYIRENFPKQHSGIFWDIFCGGGSVFVNLSNLLNQVIANDIIKELMAFYDLISKTSWNELQKFIQERKIPYDNQDIYNTLRERFNKERNPIDFFILCCSCTNNMMRFNKKFEFNQTWGKRGYNDSTQEKLKGFHGVLYNNKKISFNSKNFYELQPNKNDIVYLDPPYLITGAGYNCYWSKELEIKLYDWIDELDKNGVMFMLSNVAEHKGKQNPFLNRVSRYNIVDIPFNYDGVSRAGKSNSKEILVKNF